MLPKALIAGLLAVSLLLQGLPLTVCRCATASTGPAVESAKPAESICPRCVARTERSSDETVATPSRDADADVAFAAPCCGRSSACGCCLEKSRSRTIVTTQAAAPERPAPQALPPTDPFADVVDVSLDGVAPNAVPDVPPGRPVRILLGVWRN